MKKSNKIKKKILAAVMGVVFAGSVLAKDAPATANTDAISLKQAMLIAQQHTNAQPIKAEREMELGQSFFEITSINDQGQEINTVVSATSGDVVLSRLDIDRDDDDDNDDDLLENAAWLAGVKNGSIKSVSTVIEMAEKAHNAKVYEVEFDDDSGFITKQMVYELALVDANGRTINIDIPAQL